LVVLFSHVLHLGIKNFGAFVFCGLIVWTWFSAGVMSASSAVVGGRHLLFTARFPPATLPLVAVLVPLIDTLAALPILLVMVALTSGLHPAVVLVPLVLIVEFGITAGLALMVSALNVYFRDVENGVGVGLLLLFYLTPVFYGLKNLPQKFEVLLRANPLTAVVESMRAVILDGTLPSLRDTAISCSAAVVLLVAGWYVFRRLQPDFLDEL
jgi:lipopolysaccharide transport system permease protein